jgi:hypothetical protein
MKILGLVSIAALVALNSCATMNEDQCKTANWQEIGRNDGMQGLSSSLISSHSKACEKHGIKSDPAAYKLGYQNGVKTFCTAENGFEVGRSGRASAAECPAEMQSAFQAAWKKGRVEYDREQAAAAAAKRAQELEASRSAFFDLDSRGGICDASATVGVCFVFSGTQYVDNANGGNLAACRLFRGQYRPVGSCSRERVLGKCSVVKGTPEEYHLFYYETTTLDRRAATRDCADPKSSIHRHGAGVWTPYPM